MPVRRSKPQRRGRKRRTPRPSPPNPQMVEIERQQQLRPSPTVPDRPMQYPKKLNKIHNFRVSASRGAITTSTTIPAAGAITFILQDYPAFSDLVNLFDQYRILEVKVDFIMGGTTNPLTGPPGIVFTAIDFNDATAPTSVNDLVQYESFQAVPVGQYFERVVRPRSAVAAYSGVFTSFGNVYGMWYDTASSSVIHYGIKYFIPAIATSVYTINPIAHYLIQCRSLH